MKYLIFALCCVVSVANAQKSKPVTQYKKVHNRAIMADSHNDLLTASIEKNLLIDQDLKGKTHSDLNRFREAGVDVQIFSVWCDGEKKQPYAWANREIDTLNAVAARNPDKIQIIQSFADIKKAVKKNKLAALFGVEGGHMIEGDLNKLEALYKRGVRYMTLTWNNSTEWASSAMDESSLVNLNKEYTNAQIPQRTMGLNTFGKEVIKKMNELGMMVDLSHVGEKTFWDAIQTTTKPVLVSHSNAYTLCPVFRNLKDEQIDAVGKNGGVIQLNFYSAFIDSSFKKREKVFLQNKQAKIDSLVATGMQKEYAQSIIVDMYKEESISIQPPMEMLLKHLDYIVNRIGVDHVGMGSDFDGISASPKELTDVTTYPLITKALLERGYSKKDVYKIMGGNLLRVMKAQRN
ncbi:dipeptidase [Sediminibacterium sp. TEGAF015]|uniref:dipeptidase n=1 Tax=Sediminibacterium sp. TEGAF015 TaxID=575378 RepID=UPI0021FCC4F9|nr:dipeptidase [Sediminibacterium sp. TEGAF015]BDQ12819.1 membrane dipeptidase [Sediminibacterium sp. TEGAF015]